MRARDELLAAIDREQALIGRLGREREEALVRVRSLQAQLGTPGEDVDCGVSPSPPSTAGEKVALFRSLFRGRDDVFPKLWVNPRTDRKGYAPACSNEWVRGVCEKPRVKCSECPNQAFISVSDQVVLDHLQGRHVMGVYPYPRRQSGRSGAESGRPAVASMWPCSRASCAMGPSTTSSRPTVT